MPARSRQQSSGIHQVPTLMGGIYSGMEAVLPWASSQCDNAKMKHQLLAVHCKLVGGLTLSQKYDPKNVLENSCWNTPGLRHDERSTNLGQYPTASAVG